MEIIWSVDRIEGDAAICEGNNREMHKIPLSRLPDGVREGDCLREENGAFAVDAEETRRRREANLELFKRLAKKS